MDLTPASSLARCQLHTDIGFIPTRLLFIELQGWQFQDSKADYSTTAGWILILFGGGCWARRQLHAGIRYVSVASKLRKSLSSVEGMLGSNPGGMLLDGRLLQDYLTDSNSVSGGLLGSTPATRRYKVRTSRMKTQDFAVFCGGCLYCSTAGGGCARRKLGR